MLQKQFVLQWKRLMAETGFRKNIEKLFRQRMQFQPGIILYREILGPKKPL